MVISWAWQIGKVLQWTTCNMATFACRWVVIIFKADVDFLIIALSTSPVRHVEGKIAQSFQLALIDRGYLFLVKFTSKDKHVPPPNDRACAPCFSIRAIDESNFFWLSLAVDDERFVWWASGVKNKNPSLQISCGSCRTLIVWARTSCWALFLTGAVFQVLIILSCTVLKARLIANFAQHNTFSIYWFTSRNLCHFTRLCTGIRFRFIKKAVFIFSASTSWILICQITIIKSCYYYYLSVELGKYEITYS